MRHFAHSVLGQVQCKEAVAHTKLQLILRETHAQPVLVRSVRDKDGISIRKATNSSHDEYQLSTTELAEFIRVALIMTEAMVFRFQCFSNKITIEFYKLKNPRNRDREKMYYFI